MFFHPVFRREEIVINFQFPIYLLTLFFKMQCKIYSVCIINVEKP